MIQTIGLKNYCKDKLLDADVIDGYLIIGEDRYKIMDDEEKIFGDKFVFLPNLEADEEDIKGYVYEFCGRWYTQVLGEDVTLTELRYVGKAKQNLPTESFLGIHSGYELMNGMGLYKDWLSKAVFLGIKNLGICERNTLSGVIEFQTICKNNDIKPITGMAVTAKINGEIVDLKLYVKDFQGWLTLLKINTEINVERVPFLTVEFLSQHKSGLFIIADPKTLNFEDAPDFIDYYQLDTPTFLSEDKDIWFVDNLEKYLKSDLEPISICDAYYLEKEDYTAREQLWAIGKAFDEKTDNQYFKNKDQYAKELIQMFSSENKSWIPLYKKALANEAVLVSKCNFLYDTDTRHLPQYVMTPAEEAQFETREDLFLHLIKKGFKDRKIKNASKYIKQVQLEIDVLKAGDVIDYFLSLYDIIRAAKEKGMLTGIGRGSAGGSLVAYLLNIIQLDPLEFDLLFERFLNPGRMGEWQDRPLFIVELTDGSKIELAEGALVRIIRDGKETAVFINDLKEGDNILKY